ncbi:ROK family protein [Butyrivibrio sp. MC2013]|uniref:ROK family protein n=1 Tax=Butyrivibrio sp. MC2013 TaxID=1280686 RepID=UPI0006846DD4|nr:ROK family protein [Butyrivibrio sp. MC2013]
MQIDMTGLYIVLDVGGTGIKAGAWDIGSGKMMRYSEYPSRSGESTEVIFRNFYNIITELQADDVIRGIGYAMPGPFDYERGISLMKGLGKYDDIYGLSFKEELSRIDPAMAHIPMLFLHDVEACALGSYKSGAAAGCKSIICLCLGTGAGSAFIRDGRVIRDAAEGVPANGWIYDTPFKNSIIDDYLSARGLLKLSGEIIGEEVDGLELYNRCLEGDEGALSVYRAFGHDVAKAIMPFIDSFKPEALLVGGKISGSYAFWGKELEKRLYTDNIKIIPEPDTSRAAMQGLLAKLKDSEDAAKVI